MKVLGIDIGSSSVKAAILNRGRIAGVIVRVGFPTHFDGVRAEVSAQAIFKAVSAAIARIENARSADAIALSVMAPSWVAMDKKGKALTPIVTHQDRRSIEVAKDLEERIGKHRLLEITGNRPFPGGISSTTCAWFARHEPGILRRADLVGHLNTFLVRRLTGQRVTDPSNASFMGIYETMKLGTWDRRLCKAVGISVSQLPQVIAADRIAGKLLPAAAHELGLRAGTPVLPGVMDGSAAMLSTGARVGQLLNVAGSTDVLALCTDRPLAHEKLLTRALGVGRRWVSVATLAAGGSSLAWAHSQLFPDLDDRHFWKLVRQVSSVRSRDKNQIGISQVEFAPYLAGDRTSIEQAHGAFTNLTLSTTRQDMLAAMVDALAHASSARLPLLQADGARRIDRNVYVTGGVQHGLGKLLYRDWGKGWRFKAVEEATLKGLARLLDRE